MLCVIVMWIGVWLLSVVLIMMLCIGVLLLVVYVMSWLFVIWLFVGIGIVCGVKSCVLVSGVDVVVGVLLSVVSWMLWCVSMLFFVLMMIIDSVLLFSIWFVSCFVCE